MDDRLAALLQLLELERLEVNIFRGESRDIGSPQVYGGQVLGQALQAAYATVDADRAVHSLHAYFLRRGDFNAPIVYFVDRSRDGHSFTSRRVTAIQHGEQIFNCSASFQHAGVRPRAPAGDAEGTVTRGARARELLAASFLDSLAPAGAQVLRTNARSNSGAFRPRRHPGQRATPVLVDAHCATACPTTTAAPLPAGLRLGLPPAGRHRAASAIERILAEGMLVIAQHRSRDVVPPTGAHRRVAAVRDRQSERLGRARLRARQYLHARRRLVASTAQEGLMRVVPPTADQGAG